MTDWLTQFAYHTQEGLNKGGRQYLIPVAEFVIEEVVMGIVTGGVGTMLRTSVKLVRTADKLNDARKNANRLRKTKKTTRSGKVLFDSVGKGKRLISNEMRASAYNRQSGMIKKLVQEGGEVAVKRGEVTVKMMSDIQMGTRREVVLLRMTDESLLLRIDPASGKSVNVSGDVMRVIAHTHPGTGALKLSSKWKAARGVYEWIGDVPTLQKPGRGKKGQRSTVLIDPFGNSKRLRVPPRP